MKKGFILLCSLFLFLGALIPLNSKVLADSGSPVELTEGIRHVANEGGFTTFVDRDLLPEGVRDFTHVGVASFGDYKPTITPENVEGYSGYNQLYTSSGFGSSISEDMRGKDVYSVTMLYKEETVTINGQEKQIKVMLSYYVGKVFVEYSEDGAPNPPTEGINNLYLSEESVSIKPSQKVKIKVYVEYANGKEQDVTNSKDLTYRSLSSSVASFSKGTLTAGKKEGTTKIIFNYKGLKSELPVTVTKDQIVKLEASSKKVTVAEGETVDVDVTAVLSNGKKNNVTSLAYFTSEDSQVATVDHGEIEGIEAGETTITISYGGKEVSLPIVVTERDEEEENNITELEVGDKNIKLYIGEEKLLPIYAVYEDGSSDELSSDDVVFKSSKNSVVKVVDGIIEARGIGSATITISYKDIQTTVKVEVKKDKTVKKLVANPSSIKLGKGKEEDILITAIYLDGSKRDVTDLIDWSSKNNQIAKVEDGVIVSGKKKGTTIITAKYNGKYVNIEVTVK